MYAKCVVIMCLFVMNFKAQADLCDSSGSEVKYDIWCFKLTKLKFGQDHGFEKDCKKFESCLRFLKSFLEGLMSLYLKNPRVNGNYEFAVFESPVKSNATTRQFWLELTDKYLSGLSENNVRLNILLNSYAHKHFFYIENEVINDNEKANIMIYNSANGTQEQQCVFANQIQENNENFRFFYGDCYQKLPFICVKPFSLKQLDDINGSTQGPLHFIFPIKD
jgi:hypothetical protein